MSLGLSLPSITGQLLQGTNWDLFPWAFCRSGKQGKHTAAFLPYPRPVLPKSHTTASLGRGCSSSPFQQCWQGMGEWSSVPCSTPHSPDPISQGSIGKAEPPFPLHHDAANACASGMGRVVPMAPVLLSSLQAHPACGSFMSRSISHCGAGCWRWWV